jgi:hypothetical protein
MGEVTSGTQFATDEQLAARLRAVESKLLALGLDVLAAELAGVAGILDPQQNRAHPERV